MPRGPDQTLQSQTQSQTQTQSLSQTQSFPIQNQSESLPYKNFRFNPSLNPAFDFDFLLQ